MFTSMVVRDIFTSHGAVVHKYSNGINILKVAVADGLSTSTWKLLLWRMFWAVIDFELFLWLVFSALEL